MRAYLLKGLLVGINFILLIAFGNIPVAAQSPNPSPPISTQLTCNYPASAIPPVTHSLTHNATGITTRLGFSDTFAGIGVKFELINTDMPQNPVDIIEARSAAGAGWQYTGMLYGYDGSNALVNQGAGNCIGYQWGFKHNLQITNAGQNTALSATNLVPQYSDTFNSQCTTPCVAYNATSNPYAYLDDAQPSININSLTTTNGNMVSQIINSYSLTSKYNQAWNAYVPVQALYLSRHIARLAGLRMYIVYQNGHIDGPIIPYNDFVVENGTPIDMPFTARLWEIPAQTTKYVVFIWNIHGKDIGLVITDIQFGSTVRLQKTVFCQNAQDDTCGSIDFITKRKAYPTATFPYIFSNASFPLGSTRTYSFEYLVGLPEYLTQLGYPITPPPSPSPSPTFTISQLKTLISNYLSTSDSLYIPRDNKVNMLDAGYVIRWVN